MATIPPPLMPGCSEGSVCFVAIVGVAAVVVGRFRFFWPMCCLGTVSRRRFYGGLFCLLLAGCSLKVVAESLRAPFSLEALYHLVGRLRGRLDVLRSLLFARA